MSTLTIDASKLKNARKKIGITEQSLAEKVGIHVTNIVKYENSKANPRNDVLEKLATVLNTDLQYLVKDDCEKNEIVNKADSLTVVIEEARNKIAELAQVSPDKVNIQVSF